MKKMERKINGEDLDSKSFLMKEFDNLVLHHSQQLMIKVTLDLNTLCSSNSLAVGNGPKPYSYVV